MSDKKQERASLEKEMIERDFILKLEKLSRETGIIIGGCGCCSSPFLDYLEPPPSKEAGYGYGHMGELVWLDPENPKVIYKYCESIVK